ncbi:hypothetical protein A1OE_992 [Candidatus Endolissoclinum faulkneri L2]|uniref:Uncharacterized protein n=1 Tax=Candidatus Endolissoclinum faulkneri L2 TaxID=1193729 RepID=K7Z545_9PROT|nr:hypothetical protein A1OE_992 [Candidatus Endolissoclinum faulkneri L2]
MFLFVLFIILIEKSKIFSRVICDSLIKINFTLSTIINVFLNIILFLKRITKFIKIVYIPNILGI